LTKIESIKSFVVISWLVDLKCWCLYMKRVAWRRTKRSTIHWSFAKCLRNLLILFKPQVRSISNKHDHRSWPREKFFDKFSQVFDKRLTISSPSCYINQDQYVCHRCKGSIVHSVFLADDQMSCQKYVFHKISNGILQQNLHWFIIVETEHSSSLPLS
jgi:hypothetical protein